MTDFNVLSQYEVITNLNAVPKHHAIRDYSLNRYMIRENRSPFPFIYKDWEKTLYTYSSIGCNGKCTCCVESNNFNKIVPLSEIQYFVEQALLENIKWVILIDPTATINKQHLIETLSYLKTKPVSIGFSSRIKLWDSDIADCLIGVNSMVAFGFESASATIRNVLNKEFSNNEAQDVIQSCKDRNIRCIFEVLMGLPEETRDDLEETLNFFKNNTYAIPNFNIFSTV